MHLEAIFRNEIYVTPCMPQLIEKNVYTPLSTFTSAIMSAIKYFGENGTTLLPPKPTCLFAPVSFYYSFPAYLNDMLAL